MKADAESLRAAIKGMSVEDLFETVPNYAPHVCAPHVQCMCMYMHMCMCLSIPCVTLAHTTCITASTCAGGVQAAGRSQRQVQVRPKTPPKPAAPATSPTHTAQTSRPSHLPNPHCPHQLPSHHPDPHLPSPPLRVPRHVPGPGSARRYTYVFGVGLIQLMQLVDPVVEPIAGASAWSKTLGLPCENQAQPTAKRP